MSAPRRKLGVAGCLLLLAVLALAGPALSAVAPDGQWIKFKTAPPKPVTYQFARGWTVTLATRDEDGETITILTVRAPGAKPFRVESESVGRFVLAQFGAFALDRSSPVPVMLFDVYTGGAHCCDAVKLIELRGGKWTATDLGAWNGGFGIEDLDGDGRPELIAEDQRFLYRFGSYAGSSPAPAIYEVHGGKLVEASALPRYRRYYAGELPRYRQSCTESDLDGGPCAGFVAMTLRAGEPAAPAFAVLDESVAAHHLKGPWTIPERCGGDPSGCDRDQPMKSFPTLHAAVEWFLRDIGYLRANSHDSPRERRQ